MTQPITPVAPDPAAALELSSLLDRALADFAGEHGLLLRKACGVPAEVRELDLVVICTFLGHTLDRLSLRTGRQHTEDVVETVLEEITRQRATERAALLQKGTIQ